MHQVAFEVWINGGSIWLSGDLQGLGNCISKGFQVNDQQCKALSFPGITGVITTDPKTMGVLS